MKTAVAYLFFLFILTSYGQATASADKQAQAPVQREAKALFHLGFEKSLGASANGASGPVQAGNRPEAVDGIKGAAAFFKPGQVLQYAAAGNLDNNQGTIAMWLKLPAEDEANAKGPLTLFSEGGPEAKGSNSLKIELYPGRFIRFSLKDPKDSHIYYHKIDAWDRQEWHHLAFTWNVKKGAAIYVDGMPASIGWMPGWTPKTYDTFFVGAANARGEQACQAALDELVIYDREITEEEARKAFGQYRAFSAEVVLLDPFIRASVPGSIPVAIHNPGRESILLTRLSYVLSDQKGTALLQGPLPDQTISGLTRQMLHVPLAVAVASTYTLTLSYTENRQPRQVQAPVQVIAASEAPAAQPARQTLIAQVDAVTQPPVGEAGGTTTVSSALGAYREGGSKVRDRFALGFEVRDVNEPHVAVITYPDDKPRTMEVMLQDFGNNIDFQVHTGVFTGEEYPLSHKMLEHRVVFWPRSKKQAFIFMTAEEGYPAAVQGIKVYRLQDFAVASTNGRFAGSVPARSTGLYYEDPVLFHNFGTGRDLKGFTKAADRMIQYMQSFGQTEVEYPLAWYAGPLYGTAVEPFQPDIDGAQGGQRPHPAGYPAYLLQRLGEHNMKFTAGLHIHTLPSLNKYAVADTARIHKGDETVININKDGKLWYGYWHGADPNYNPADPRVMASVNAIVQEITARYAKAPAFDGISLVMARPKLFTFGSLASGYNDSNLQRFQKEAGIRIPTYTPGDPERFAKSYTWLMENPAARKAWIDWRCQVLYEHYAAMASQMAAYRADLKLKLNVFVHLTHNERLADYLAQPPVEVMREMGIDPALYKDHPNILLNYTSVPADLRWKRSHYPPARHEVNRTVMTAPEVVASLTDHKQVRMTIHDRYWEDPVGSEQPLEGLKAMGVREMVWRASTFNGARFHSLEPYMFALHHLDATSMVKGGYVVGTFGMEQELARFSQALQALPAVKFEEVPAVSDPVRIRQQVVDGRLYFYVLNTLPEPVEINVRLKEAGALREPVTGNSRRKSRKHRLSLEPYGLQVFTSASVDQRVVGGEVKVPKEWYNKLQAAYERVWQVGQEKGTDTGKYAPYLALARQSWETGQYSRLYFLLQESWARELLRANAGAVTPLSQ
ncbi:LamG domain-containing protein [Pontibacter litorisediminis]|uniref:LamG domain-containing protein n=1 Tax=Pontibacter litorisediminis TaxID=1846260 RepID=UPI0023EB3956|nr:LamG domain-containing protein [Pontibacter litorisediminis]